MENIDLNYANNSELFNSIAKDWAEKIETSKCPNKKGRIVDMKTKKTQLRNFYDKVLELVQKSESDEWENVLPFVKMLNAQVAYGLNREVVNCEFSNMIKQCTNQINKPKDLLTFKLFFEAVLGFFKGSN